MASSLRTFVFSLLVVLVALSASAGQYGEALGQCLLDSTSRADRTALVQWIFVAFSAHPDVKSLSAVTPQKHADVTKKAAAVFERLLTDSCAKQTRDAIQHEGSDTVQAAFSKLGETAMNELIANPEVAAGFEELAKSIDQEKLAKAFQAPQ